MSDMPNPPQNSENAAEGNNIAANGTQYTQVPTAQMQSSDSRQYSQPVYANGTNSSDASQHSYSQGSAFAQPHAPAQGTAPQYGDSRPSHPPVKVVYSPAAGRASIFGAINGASILLVGLVYALVLGIVLSISIKNGIVPGLGYTDFISTGFVQLFGFLMGLILNGVAGAGFFMVSTLLITPIVLGVFVAGKVANSQWKKAKEKPIIDMTSFWISVVIMTLVIFFPSWIFSSIVGSFSAGSFFSGIFLDLLLSFIVTYMTTARNGESSVDFKLVDLWNRFRRFVAPGIYVAVVILMGVGIIGVIPYLASGGGFFKQLVAVLVLPLDILIHLSAVYMGTPMLVDGASTGAFSFGVVSLIVAIFCILFVIFGGVIVRHRVRGYDPSLISIVADTVVFFVCALVLFIITQHTLSIGISGDFGFTKHMGVSAIIILILPLYGLVISVLHVYVLPSLCASIPVLGRWFEKLNNKPLKKCTRAFAVYGPIGANIPKPAPVVQTSTSGQQPYAANQVAGQSASSDSAGVSPQAHQPVQNPPQDAGNNNGMPTPPKA